MKCPGVFFPVAISAMLFLAGLATAQNNNDSKKQQNTQTEHKADLSKAKDVVNRITPSVPQEVHRSTETTSDVARREEQSRRAREKGAGVDNIKVPPPPSYYDKRNNPTGDKDVHDGYVKTHDDIMARRAAEKKAEADKNKK